MIIRKGTMPAGWTALPNLLLEDGRLSLKARGLLCYLLSRPDGWETDSERLAASSHAQRDGRDSIRTALRELVTLRYIVRVKTQNAKGHWATSSYVYDEPQADPAGEKPPVDNPVDSVGDNSVDNQAPTTGYPTVGQPGAINNTKEQEIERLQDATTREAVDNSGSALAPASGSGNAALASGSPSAAAPGGAGVAVGDNAAELTLDDFERAALERASLLAPDVAMFALRAHARAAWGQGVTMESALVLVQWHARRGSLRIGAGGRSRTAAELVGEAVFQKWEPPTRRGSASVAAPRPSRE